jgi:hypothetical protein
MPKASSLEIFTDVEQGSPEWAKLRLGLCTASNFSCVQARGQGGGDSKTRATYLYKLAGEIICGEPAESYTNAYMERGRAMEDEARNMYALVSGEEPQRVGFMRNGPKGASPDSLIGDRGGLEIKTQTAHLLIPTLLKGNAGFPAEHTAQIQGNIWIAERDWWDLAIYWPKLPLFTRRVWRDDVYIRNLAMAVDQFNNELDELVEKIRAMQ